MARDPPAERCDYIDRCATPSGWSWAFGLPNNRHRHSARMRSWQGEPVEFVQDVLGDLAALVDYHLKAIVQPRKPVLPSLHSGLYQNSIHKTCGRAAIKSLQGFARDLPFAPSPSSRVTRPIEIEQIQPRVAGFTTKALAQFTSSCTDRNNLCNGTSIIGLCPAGSNLRGSVSSPTQILPRA